MELIAEVPLHDGRRMAVYRFVPPDAQAGEEVSRLLGHKGEPFKWQIQQCLAGATSGMDSLFHVGRVDGQLVGNATVFRNGSMGCLAHVFTMPQWRRLGVARAVLNHAMAQFEATGGSIMVLGTGFDSMPWHLYEQLGFVGISPQERYGGMARFLGGATWEDAFPASDAEVQPADWRHFVGAQVLFGSPSRQQMRSMHLPCAGRRFVEGQFARLMSRQAVGKAPLAWVLEGPERSVLGMALLGRSPLWNGLARREVLDIYWHDAAGAQAGALAATAIAAAAGPLECYVDDASGPRISLLHDLGFREQRFTGALKADGSPMDLVIMARD